MINMIGRSELFRVSCERNVMRPIYVDSIGVPNKMLIDFIYYRSWRFTVGELLVHNNAFLQQEHFHNRQQPDDGKHHEQDMNHPPLEILISLLTSKFLANDCP